MNDFVVPAEAYTSDLVYRVKFDAIEWLSRAEDGSLVSLDFCRGKENKLATDVVIWTARNTKSEELKDLVQHYWRNYIDVSLIVVIDENSALAWLKRFRPTVYRNIQEDTTCEWWRR